MILTPASSTFTSGMAPSELPDRAMGFMAKGATPGPSRPLSRARKAAVQIVREGPCNKKPPSHKCFKGKTDPRRDDGTEMQFISAVTDTVQNP
jgi:hypothetical protein